MAGEPTTEELAAQSFNNLQNMARQIAFSDGSDIGAAMIAVLTDSGVHTVPHVHHEYDSRHASLWLLGAILAHMDDSTPDDTHPLEIADHALAVTEEYEDDPHVGWSGKKSVDGEPWEAGGEPEGGQ